jgi:hypothetical protein
MSKEVKRSRRRFSTEQEGVLLLRPRVDKVPAAG